MKNLPFPVVRRTRSAFHVFVFPSRNQNHVEQRKRNVVAFRSFRRFRRLVRICREFEKRPRSSLRFFRRPLCGRGGRRFGHRGRSACRIGGGRRKFRGNAKGNFRRNFLRNSGRVRGWSNGGECRRTYRRAFPTARRPESGRYGRTNAGMSARSDRSHCNILRSRIRFERYGNFRSFRVFLIGGSGYVPRFSWIRRQFRSGRRFFFRLENVRYQGSRRGSFACGLERRRKVRLCGNPVFRSRFLNAGSCGIPSVFQNRRTL